MTSSISSSDSRTFSVVFGALMSTLSEEFQSFIKDLGLATEDLLALHLLPFTDRSQSGTNNGLAPKH